MPVIQRARPRRFSCGARRQLGCRKSTRAAGLVAIVLWLGTMVGHAAEESGPLIPAETIRLFNGQDLDDFYTWLVDTKHEDPRHVFACTNGVIRISGDGLGYLATKKEYQNFHLLAEFKWGNTNWPWGERVGKPRDSGVFLHAIGPDGNSHDGNGQPGRSWLQPSLLTVVGTARCAVRAAFSGASTWPGQRGARSVPPAARGRGRRSAASLPTNFVRTVNTFTWPFSAATCRRVKSAKIFFAQQLSIALGCRAG